MKVELYKSTKALMIRPIILSLTLGIIWAFFVTGISLISFFTQQVTALTLIINPLYRQSVGGIILGFIWGGLTGWILGCLIGSIYRYLIRKKVEADRQFVLGFDRDQKVNVIQPGAGDQPYTIVFVANPALGIKEVQFSDEVKKQLPQKSVKSNPGKGNSGTPEGKMALLRLLKSTFNRDSLDEITEFDLSTTKIFQEQMKFSVDPVIENRDLFYRVVIRCLKSFINNELLNLPEIFDRLRLVTVFPEIPGNPQDGTAFCEGLDPMANILAPRVNEQDRAVVASYLANNIAEADIASFETPDLLNSIRYPDVVFIISGSRDFTRSSARFTRDEDDNDAPTFEFTFSGANGSTNLKGRHSRYAQHPGVVALSAWDDRLKTPVHEFAHAMSSLENGAIVDEYCDEEISGIKELFQNQAINKKYRTDGNQPIPDIFARYRYPAGNKKPGASENSVVYYSDRNRNDKSPGWVSYVPEGVKPGISCIMDIAYFSYRFDRLLFDFMYDRLLAKLNRSSKQRQ